MVWKLDSHYESRYISNGTAYPGSDCRQSQALGIGNCGQAQIMELCTEFTFRERLL
jgi:hypothetical protein